MYIAITFRYFEHSVVLSYHSCGLGDTWNPSQLKYQFEHNPQYIIV